MRQVKPSVMEGFIQFLDDLEKKKRKEVDSGNVDEELRDILLTDLSVVIPQTRQWVSQFDKDVANHHSERPM